MKIPVALNCCELPSGSVGVAVEMVIEARAAAETLRFPAPVMLPDVAEIPAVPIDLAAAKPVVLIATTPGDKLFHVTELIRGREVPSV